MFFPIPQKTSTPLVVFVAFRPHFLSMMEAMMDEFDNQLEKLERTLADLQQASKQALGFVRTVDYQGIPFNVSQRFVIADLSPLAFFHLVEHITDDVASAIVRLHDRLHPLLTCQHDWVPLKRAEDDQIRTIVRGTDRVPQPTGPFVCRFCTAYALGSSLPTVGRTLP